MPVCCFSMRPDAVFVNRSEVKDAHDRHANIEVSHLLKRLETYAGLVILS